MLLRRVYATKYSLEKAGNHRVQVSILRMFLKNLLPVRIMDLRGMPAATTSTGFFFAVKLRPKTTKSFETPLTEFTPRIIFRCAHLLSGAVEFFIPKNRTSLTLLLDNIRLFRLYLIHF